MKLQKAKEEVSDLISEKYQLEHHKEELRKDLQTQLEKSSVELDSFKQTKEHMEIQIKELLEENNNLEADNFKRKNIITKLNSVLSNRG